MLNLLKFKEIADYSGNESLKPTSSITGKEAYQLYSKHTLPLLKLAGSKVLYAGESKGFIIGPEQESWDMVLLVEHESIEKFMEFAQQKAYQQIAGHRTAALQDSRLLPSSSIIK